MLSCLPQHVEQWFPNLSCHVPPVTNHILPSTPCDQSHPTEYPLWPITSSRVPPVTNYILLSTPCDQSHPTQYIDQSHPPELTEKIGVWISQCVSFLSWIRGRRVFLYWAAYIYVWYWDLIQSQECVGTKVNHRFLWSTPSWASNSFWFRGHIQPIWS